MTPYSQHRPAITSGGWIIAGSVGFLMFAFMNVVLVRDPNTPGPAQVILPILTATVMFGYCILIAYIYGDAKRRGMRYIPWTILAALAPSAIGIILYFILREPMPVHCTKCGSAMNPGFAFCPRCGSTMSATCFQCHRVSQPGWSHCAWCGAKL
jgi:hypothetical protein